MRPPMTSAKNDGVPPPIRKTQLNQKEVLAENQNQKIRLPYQLNVAKDENSRVRIHQVQADEFIDRRNDSDSSIEVYTDDGIELTRPPSDSFSTYRQTNSKLKRFSSDVSDKFIANSKIPLVSRNISNGSLNNSKTNNKSPSSHNSGEVPKNLIINAFDQCQYNSKVSSALVLPLSETEPLLTNIETTVSDPTRSICLNKTSASLIFTKKDISKSNGSIDRNSSSANYNPTYIVHRRSSGANKQNCTISTNSEFDCKPEAALLQHRRSLQLNYSTLGKDSIGTIRPSSTATNRKQHAYSWYAPVYSALEEESEQDSRNSSPIHNLANIRNNIKSENETVSLIEKNHLNIQPQLHHPRIRRSGVCSLPINGVNGTPLTANQNENDGPQAPSLLGGPLPRRRRFENFLKSLVGRKPSKESIATNTISNPPLLPSPEITISPSPSDHDLLRDPGNLNDRITSSTTSLNTVQHKIWNVVPLLKREGSATSLRPEKSNSIVQYTGLRKCETVLALARQSSMVEQIKPQNRLRNSLSVNNNATCSRCSSLLSLAATGSRYSLNPASSGFMTIKSASNNNLFQRTSSNINVNSTAAIPDNNETITCKLCLADVTGSEITRIGHCGCSFCTECMKAYIEFEITEGAYDISCPDAQCPIQGSMTLLEISVLGSTELMERHHRYRLNREIEMDKTRTWCPRAGCETVCLVGTTPIASSSSTEDKVNSITHVLCAVQCPTCREEFCSGCKKPWHSNLSCEENNRRLIAEGQDDSIAILFDNDLIKCCPMCAVPIEKDEGCAQMMCKRCKHVFCWYCLASLDDDFLLRHYDKGPCKNKLGHSRASVVWHRAQVIGIFAGFGILLLVASPLLLLAAPCIICCKCRICSGSTKLEEADPDFEEAIALQSSSPLNAGNLDIDASKNEEIKFRNVKCDETRQH